MRSLHANLLRKSSAVFGVVLFATPTGASISMDGWAPVSDMELAGKRGAYIARNGVEIEFGARFYAIADGNFKADLEARIDQKVEAGMSGLDSKAEGVAGFALPEAEPAVQVAASSTAEEVVVASVVDMATPSAVVETAASSGFRSEHVEVMDVTPAAPAAPTSLASDAAVAKAAVGPPVALVSSSKSIPEPALPATPDASMRARVEILNEFVLGEGGGVQREVIDLGQTQIVQQVSADGMMGLIFNTANNISVKQQVEIDVYIRNYREVFESPSRMNARAASRLMNAARFHSIRQ